MPKELKLIAKNCIFTKVLSTKYFCTSIFFNGVIPEAPYLIL